VFGAPLGWTSCGLLPLPRCILNAMGCLVRSAPEAVGIFRKSGVRSRIQKLRDDIEANPGRPAAALSISRKYINSAERV